MKTLVYSAREFEVPYLEAANAEQHAMHFITPSLNQKTAANAKGYTAISIFLARLPRAVRLRRPGQEDAGQEEAQGRQ